MGTTFKGGEFPVALKSPPKLNAEGCHNNHIEESEAEGLTAML